MPRPLLQLVHGDGRKADFDVAVVERVPAPSRPASFEDILADNLQRFTTAFPAVASFVYGPDPETDPVGARADEEAARALRDVPPMSLDEVMAEVAACTCYEPEEGGESYCRLHGEPHDFGEPAQ
jgi:hypothetical protein